MSGRLHPLSIAMPGNDGGAEMMRVEGEHYAGVFAVHRRMELYHGQFGCASSPPFWTLTHVPTGRAVVYIDSRSQGHKLARSLLDRAVPVRWRSKDAQALQRNAQAVLAAASDMGLEPPAGALAACEHNGDEP